MFHQFIDIKDKQLFSVYHDPEVVDHNETGVLLCYPYGQEYIRCHKLYVNMANKLAKRGYHALRFDYYGTGDSPGDCTALTVKDSLNDIEMVIRQFRESCGVSRIVLFGVRIGASLAFLYSRNHGIDALILWDPVLDGRSYLEGIDRRYRTWLKGPFTKGGKKRHSGMENFGFLYSMGLVNEIRGVNISREQLRSDIPTLVLDSASEYWIKREDEFDKAMVPVNETHKSLEWLDNLLC
jgi:pimeloyl-ACP methyl ester carboxylesterase